MGHVSTWLHTHHWDTREHRKADWRTVLLMALIAGVVFVVIMLMFPRPTY